jgi:DNA segregation ATPase FtsK/SpoIIIE-like protein
MADVAVVAPAAPAAPAQTAVTTPAAPEKAAAAPVTEATKTAPAPVKEATPEQKDQERRAAMLANAKRVEAGNRKAEAEIKAQREQLRQEQVEWQQKQDAKLKAASEYERLSPLVSDPLKLLAELKISQEDILKAMVKGDTRTPDEIAEAVYEKKMAAQRIKDEEAAKAAKTEAEKQHNETLRQMKAKTIEELNALIAKETEKYEFCSLRPDAGDLAYQYMDKHYKDTFKTGRPEILPMSDCIDKVEEALEADFYKFQGSSKKLAAKAAAAAEEKKKADAAAVAAETAKAARSRFFTDSTPRQAVKPAPAESPKPQTLKNRRQLIADINAQLAKNREQQ